MEPTTVTPDILIAQIIQDHNTMIVQVIIQDIMRTLIILLIIMVQGLLIILLIDLHIFQDILHQHMYKKKYFFF
jgi:hypothetical protein